MIRYNTKKGLALAVGVTATLGFAASSAQATEFQASAAVENALEVTKIDDMDFGTIFAQAASSGTYSSLVLEPNGDISTNQEADGFPLLSLGGEVPARAEVAASDPFTVELPAAVSDNADADLDNTANEDLWEADGIVELEIDGGDPDVAKLLLTNLRIGDVVGAGDPDAPDNPDTDNTWTIDPDFGVDVVQFGIGGELATDDGAGEGGDRVSYEEGTYSGTFEVTASF